MRRLSEQELAILECVDRWKRFAIDHIEDMILFRDCLTQSLTFGFSNERQRERELMCFKADTELIVSWIIARHSNLESSSVFEAFRVIALWFDITSGVELPSDTVLRVLLDRALMVVGAIANVVNPHTSPNRTDEHQTIRPASVEEEEHLIRSMLSINPTITSGEIGKKLGIPAQTVRKRDAWRQARPQPKQKQRNRSQPEAKERPLTDRMLSAISSPGNNAIEEIDESELLEREFLESATREEKKTYHQLPAEEKPGHLFIWKSERNNS